MALFRQEYVVDTNGLPVVGLKGRIYEVGDSTGTTPLAVTDAGGVPIALISISELGVNQSFQVEDRTQVLWISEDTTTHVIFESLDAMEERAATATATAESALQQVAAFSDRIGVPGGIAGLNSEGNVIDANASVVGNDTRRSGAVIFATGSDTPRPTSSREVMVLWITDGPAPVNALPGIDYWLNGGVAQ